MATYDPHSHVEKLRKEIERLKSEVQRLRQTRLCARCCQSAPPLFDASPDATSGCSNPSHVVETRKDDDTSSSTIEAFCDDTIVRSNVLQVVENCNGDNISTSIVDAFNVQTVQASKNDTIRLSNDHQALVKFIEYCPGEDDSRVSTSTKQTPSRKYADELSDKILSTDVSTSTNCVDNFCVNRIRAILRGVSTLNTSSSPHPSAEDPLQALRNFSGIIKGTKEAKNAISKIHAFQQLIFVSACVVLKSDGFDDPLIDDAIRLCVSKPKVSKSKVSKSKVSKSKVSKSKVSKSKVSKSKVSNANNYAFERCPQWIGEQISKWGDLATEYLFHSGMSIYKYSVMADSPKSSATRIIERIVSAEVAPASIQAALAAALSDTAPKASATTIVAVPRVPLKAACITLEFPVFVQVVLDRHYSLAFICEKLNFRASYATPQKESLYEQYIAIRDGGELKCQKRTWDDFMRSEEAAGVNSSKKSGDSNRSHAQPRTRRSRSIPDSSPQMEPTDIVMDTSCQSSVYTPDQNVEQHRLSPPLPAHTNAHETSDGLEADNCPKFEALVRSSSAVRQTDSTPHSIYMDHLNANQESLHRTESLAGSAQPSPNTDIDRLTSSPLHPQQRSDREDMSASYWGDMSGSYWEDMSDSYYDMAYWGSMTTDPEALRDSYRSAMIDSGLARR